MKPETQEEIRALGRLEWTLRRIEEATGMPRETISRYLRVGGYRSRVVGAAIGAAVLLGAVSLVARRRR